MNSERIKELANKGFITQIEVVEKLSKLSEAELIDMGYITQTSIFDGEDVTMEEVKKDEPVVDTPVDAPIVDEGDEDEPVVDTPVDAPIVDEVIDTEEIVEEEIAE